MDKSEKNEITYEYTKRRREFGKQTLFEDHGPEMCVSIPCNPNYYKNYILRNPVHVAIQNTSTMSEHWVNSVRAEYTNSGINHIEGGWPKDINMNDPEATQRYRRKIEKDDAYIHAVMHLGHSMEHNILQNNAVDMYQIYYSELPRIPPVEKSSCHTVNVYREPGIRRPVRSLSWQTDGGARLAAAHADVEFMRNNRTLQLSYIWDIENANAPELKIKPPQPLLDLQYNPRDQHTLVGGMMNGQVGWWDTRKGSDPVGVCPPHMAHRDLVRNVLFINSKTGAECFSSSPDGVVKWWDTRNMSEPTDSMIIDLVKLPNDAQNMENALGISALEYEPTIPTRFMVGTETGLVIGANRKGKTPLEKLPSKGLLVACGSSKGTIYLAELSQNLGTADKNDKQLLTHILERENKRERILEARMRELRLKMRQDRDCGQAQVTESDATNSDRDLEEATAEYNHTINELMAQQKVD
ncbi:unnamed protein product [Parnassius apollo]|uniref:(apollo) hypothetical protein n=1 Tax=Parnassius apollo TaxID=110799 RepID=A0A8S3XKF6_PARAO|nr:unnamed protein product [Parnassius apollo]